MSKSELKGWKSEPHLVKDEDLDRELSWIRAYFHSSEGNGGSEWVRNLHEVRQRDLMLFNLGNLGGKNVLDVGCGAGEYLRTVGKMGASYLGGQDLDENAVKRGRVKFDEEKLEGKLVIGDCQKLDFPDNFFDAAFSSDFFEHISKDVKENVVNEVFRVLKPGGVFVIKTPNLSYLRLIINLKRFINLLRLRSPFIYIAHTKDNPDNEHYGLTTHSELESILEDSFFHTPEITHTPLIRKRLPMFITNLLHGKKLFSESIIITAKKSIFYGIWG
tara:strand:+ start:550 stop:1371 length:822 start_codon:yes stop_codon:yes gene_type:complete